MGRRLPSVRTEQRPPLDAQAKPHSEPSQWLWFGLALLAMTVMALVNDVSKVIACTGLRVSAVAHLLFQYKNLKRRHLLDLHLVRLAHIILFR